MRKTLTALLGAAVVLALGACSITTGGTSADPGTGSSGSADPGTAGKTIYVLGPTPDHGWTAQAGTYANKKVEEINAAGQWKAEYMAASDGEQENDFVSQLIANGDAAGVVYFALDDSAKAGAEALIAAKIPFMFFDRIIEGPDKEAILNYSGDNWAVGAGIAYWLQKSGMKPGDTLVTLIGDNGTVSGRRQEGFESFLKGELKYSDEKTGEHETTQTWTEEEVAALTATYKEVCDWSADKAYQYLEQKLPDIITDAKAKGGNLYVFSMDDEMTFGFLNLIEGNTLGDAAKKDLESLKVNISAIGGMQELYDVMDGKAAQSALADQYFDDMMSVSFNPKMMTSAVELMVQYLDEDNWTYSLGEGKYEPVFIVDRTNAAEVEGFQGHE